MFSFFRKKPAASPAIQPETPPQPAVTPPAHTDTPPSANGCVDRCGKRSFAGLGADGGDSDTCT
jgi:hypothetical protein